MLFPFRHLIASLSFFIFLTIYYLHAVWNPGGFYSARTFHGRVLGIVGLLFVVASLFSGDRHPQDTNQHSRWYSWHLLLGTMSICVILAHAGFRFGNLIATFGFLFLVGVVLSGFSLATLEYYSSRLDQTAQTPRIRLANLRRRWMKVHAILTAGLMAFVLVHILSILYY